MPTVDSFDDSHPFYDREVVVTGSLGSGWTKRDAAQAVVNVGGTFAKNLRMRTNFLVVADYSGCRTIRGGLSGKHRKALEYKARGADIEIIDADTFFEMLKL